MVKHIQIDDRSAAGWDTLEEYQSDLLRSDSDDERKIRAAEKRVVAAKKAKTITRNYKSAKPIYLDCGGRGYWKKVCMNIDGNRGNLIFTILLNLQF